MQTKTIRGKKQQQHKTNNITKWLGKQQNMLAHFVYTQPIHKFHSDYTPGHNKALCILIRWATMRNARAFSLCFPCLPHRTIFWDGFIVVSSVFLLRRSQRRAQGMHNEHTFFFLFILHFFIQYFFVLLHCTFHPDTAFQKATQIKQQRQQHRRRRRQLQKRWWWWWRKRMKKI